MTRRIALWSLVIAAVVAVSAALAQTGGYGPSPGAGMGGFRATCGEDVRRLCPGVPRGEGRVMQCLANYRNQLSPACRASLADGGGGAGPGTSGYGPGPTGGGYRPNPYYGSSRSPNGYGYGPNAYNPNAYSPDPNAYGPDPNADGYRPGRNFGGYYGPGTDPNGYATDSYGTARDPESGMRLRREGRGFAAGDASSSGQGDTQGSIVTADGHTRTYAIHVPAGYDANKTYPLVLLFHGGYGSGARILSTTQFAAKADREGFIVVAPDGIDRHWNDGKAANPTIDDVGFVRQLIKMLESRFGINPKRIYATGISNGGEFTERLGCELSDTLAAIGTAAGPIAANLLSSCKPGPIAVVGIQGTADPLAPLNGGQAGGGYAMAKGGVAASAAQTMKLWAAVNGCNQTAKVTNIPPSVNDGTRVAKYDYPACAAGTNVVYYIVQGMGHGWPPRQGALDSAVTGPISHNINATDVMWGFFRDHSR
jgi:polyhydroxybutyrate depolymerase